ncbi:MAG TPA: glycoside hydrolase [Flavitalea sp.]|nr:glycoside hydrolase [Flavitalea sp.]
MRTGTMQQHIYAVLILLFLTGSISLRAQEKRLYIANDEHTDYMWSANETQYDSAFVHMLDYYLDQIDATKSNPSDFQARFNCDGSIWLKAYEQHRTPEQFSRLIAAIRSGHISSPLNMVVSTYGAQPTEAVLRGMYWARLAERRLGLRFRMAVAMEDQTMPLGLSSLWAGSGAKFSWKGVCACATKIPEPEFRNRRHQLYNYAGLDGSGVVMKWYNLGKDNTFLGGYAEARGGFHPEDTLAGIKSVIKELDLLCGDGSSLHKQYPYRVAGAFGYGWDDLATFVSPYFIEAAKQMTNSNRKVRVSNEEDFFEDILRTYPELPSETVSYGNEWDLYSASMNETTAKVRRATEKLRNAEAIASVVGLKNKGFYNSFLEMRNRAWDGFGLYWEHDWTADGPISREERGNWQIKIQEQISAYSDSLLAKGVKELGSQIKSGNLPRFYVFNSLSWTRTDIADIAYTGNYPVEVIDLSTNKPVPAQLIHKSGAQYLRVLAENIPSVGYKVFEIREGSGQTGLPDAATLKDNYFSNNYYGVKLSPSGVITEIYDSLANRQLARENMGQLVNDLGVENINDGSALTIVNAGPVSVTIKASSKNPIPHSTYITLFAGQPRIDIEDSIQSNFSDLKTWSFSFDLDKPTTRHEELGSILTAKKETAGGHYASQNARYDWLTLNHFVDMSEQDYGVTLSNIDCSFFRLGNSTTSNLDDRSAQIHALAGGTPDPGARHI